VAQAQVAVADYYQVLNELSADPGADLSILKDVAISSGLVDAETEVNFDRSRDRRQIGATKVASISVTNVTLQFAPDTTPPTIPTVQLDVCYDVSEVDVVDINGDSVVKSDRPDTGLARLGVANYDWPEPTGWKIAFSEVKGDACPDAL